MIEKYQKETIDIEDAEFEEYDIEEAHGERLPEAGVPFSEPKSI